MKYIKLSFVSEIQMVPEALQLPQSFVALWHHWYVLLSVPVWDGMDVLLAAPHENT